MGCEGAHGCRRVDREVDGDAAVLDVVVGGVESAALVIAPGAGASGNYPPPHMIIMSRNRLIILI